MAWTVKFNQDTTTSGLGTVTASDTDFNYARRVDTNNSSDVESFVSEAKTNQTAKDAETAANAAIQAAILALLEA